MSKDTPLIDYMKRKNIPQTRQNYLEINHMGKAPSQLSPELEAEMPEKLQLPKEEEEGMPKPPAKKGETKAPEQGPDIYIGKKEPLKLGGQMDTEEPVRKDDGSYASMDMSTPHSGPVAKVGNRSLDLGNTPKMDGGLSQKTQDWSETAIQ